ncbi:DUF4268 domain-containing protein [Gemmatimonadota bacterium DH-20]|uniref:DUF4268 domain-containing protein n=1 Tax=Gaopeijia maritima TaxID=3119007 RepID=A0ABU9EDA5_9BACT
MDLVVEDSEVQVGPFRADILCRDETTEGLVLVENQLERTNHMHLGQVLTYAAGLDAAAIIWIASEFAEPHREALTWLNHITGDEFHFFGIQVELWRIGDSPPAPRLNLIVKPNDWAKQVRGARSTSPDAARRADIHEAVWASLHESLTAVDVRLALPSPARGNTYRITLEHGRCNFGYSPTNRQLSAYILFRGDDPVALWKRVLARRAEIDRDLQPTTLEWSPAGERGFGYIKAVFPLDHHDQASLRTAWHWAHEMVRYFDELFRAEASRL